MGIGETRKIKITKVDGSKLTIKEENFGEEFTIDNIFDYMEECQVGYAGSVHKIKSQDLVKRGPYWIDIDDKKYVVVDTSGDSIKFAFIPSSPSEKEGVLEVKKKNLVDYLKSHEIGLPRDSSIFPW